MTISEELHWDEPDIGCVSCGKRYVTVDDHRCGECLDEPVGFCPLCLGVIGALIDREVVRRMRQAANDVNDAWVEGRRFSRILDRLQVDANRAATRAKWTA
jgi:hypothetical protein